MTRLAWVGEVGRLYKSGIDRAVLYLLTEAVPWNGLVSISEQPSDADIKTAYFDGQKYTQSRSAEGLILSIDSFTFPDELLDNEEPFGIVYRIMKDAGYELHLIYNCELQAQEIGYVSIDTSVSPALFQWNLATRPTIFDQSRATSHVVIDTHDTHPDVILWLEWQLYGTDTSAPRLPPLDEIVSVFRLNATFTIVDNGDGTFTATGPTEYIQAIDSTTFKIVTPSIDYVNDNTYKIRSW
jgi:hypothetical protein